MEKQGGDRRDKGDGGRGRGRGGGGGGGRGQGSKDEGPKKPNAGRGDARRRRPRSDRGGVPVEDGDVRVDRRTGKNEERERTVQVTTQNRAPDTRRRRPVREVLAVPAVPPFTAFLSDIRGGRASEKEVFALLGPNLMAEKIEHRWRDTSLFIDFKTADGLVACLKLNGSRVQDGALRVEVARPLKKEAASKGKRGGRGGDRDRAKFKEFLPLDSVKEMLDQGLLCQGALRVNPHNRREAYVTVKDFGYDVKLTSLSAQNRAFDCDVVAIRINPVSAWIKMDEAVAENSVRTAAGAAEVAPFSAAEDADSLSSEDEDETVAEVAALAAAPLVPLTELQEQQKKAAAENLRPTGVVVAILEEHHPTSYVGWLRSCNDDEELTRDSKFAFFVPFAKKMHRMLVPLDRLKLSWRNAEKYAKNLYSCELKSWNITSSCPFGVLVKDYGEGGNLEVEKTILMEANGIDFDDSFSVACNACLPPKDYAISEEEISKRRDLRKTLICSIDPATARDLDDALSIQRLANGNWEVGVHIADVTHFLQAGTALDEEARSRCTSVYLVDQCIPMLPRILSEKLCSLNSGQDSLAFSAIFELSSAGEIVSEWFGKSIIRNVMQMSYETAQSIIDGVATDEQFKIDPTVAHLHSIADVRHSIITLNKLGHVLRKIRFDNGGSVQLESVKLVFKLDEQTGKPLSVSPYVQKPANELVEEFMLLANKQVAGFLLRKFPEGALLRMHAKPGLKMKDFVAVCAKFGYKVDPSTSFTLNASLANIQDPNKPGVRKVIYHLALRAMQLAKYTHTDLDFPSETHYWHFALAYQHYTHFTSPIRRYADCMVHRILFCALQNQPQPETKETIAAICEKCNERKTLADRASDRSDVVFLCHLLKDRKPEIVEGYIFRVNAKGIDVMVPQYGIEDTIAMDKIGLVKEAKYSEDNFSLSVDFDSFNADYFIEQNIDEKTDRRSLKQTFSMFDKVNVICTIKDGKRELDMGLKLVIENAI